MSLRQQIFSDNDKFLNLDEFGTTRTVKFDGNTYEDIPIVMTAVRENRFQNVATVSARKKANEDYQEGTFVITAILHCKLADLNGNLPEQGIRLKVNDEEGSSYFDEFFVASSRCEMGMVRIALENVDE